MKRVDERYIYAYGIVLIAAEKKDARRKILKIRTRGYSFTIPSFTINVTYLWLKRNRGGALRALTAPLLTT